MCVAGRVCRSWRVFAIEVLLRDTAISRPKRCGARRRAPSSRLVPWLTARVHSFGAVLPGRAAPAATSTLATQVCCAKRQQSRHSADSHPPWQAACVRNADAVSSGVSSGEAISSKQKRLTGSRHETESAPPRDGGAAGPRTTREADSGRVARLRRTEPGGLEPAPGADDAVAASLGVRSAGAEGAGPAGGRAGNAAGRRHARDEAGASDLAVVFSPAGGVVTGHESEDADEDVRSTPL